MAIVSFAKVALLGGLSPVLGYDTTMENLTMENLMSDPRYQDIPGFAPPPQGYGNYDPNRNRQFGANDFSKYKQSEYQTRKNFLSDECKKRRVWQNTNATKVHSNQANLARQQREEAERRARAQQLMEMQERQRLKDLNDQRERQFQEARTQYNRQDLNKKFLLEQMGGACISEQHYDQYKSRC